MHESELQDLPQFPSSSKQSGLTYPATNQKLFLNPAEPDFRLVSSSRPHKVVSSGYNLSESNHRSTGPHEVSIQMACKTYIVEHLDEELGSWSELEYITIAKESHLAGAKFCLSSVPPTLVLPIALKHVPGFTADERSVEALYAEGKTHVCLLDPSATKELSPEDGGRFNVFLFGGILGELLAPELEPHPSLTLTRG